MFQGYLDSGSLNIDELESDRNFALQVSNVFGMLCFCACSSLF